MNLFTETEHASIFTERCFLFVSVGAAPRALWGASVQRAGGVGEELFLTSFSSLFQGK